MVAARQAFCFEDGFSIFTRGTFNIYHGTDRSLPAFSGKDEAIAFVTDEKMIHDDQVAKKFWNEIIFERILL